MRIVAITAFPPSKGALSTVGYHAVSRFLESPDISELIILADKIDPRDPQHGKATGIADSRVTIKRCWRFNAITNLFVIGFAVLQHKPDVVWLNLQYTTFGTRLIPAFLGLLIPALLKLFGIPVVVLLHNFLAAVDLPQMGFHLPRFMLTLLRRADRLSMQSLASADKVFLLDPTYYAQFTAMLPSANAQCIEQDLYEIPPYEPVDSSKQLIVTMGNFGTYKKLEVLLDAFLILQKELPASYLKLAGQSHPFAPSYFAEMQDAYAAQSPKIDFVGYVDELDMGKLFQGSNIVVLTNSTVTGSSAILRHAARFGRAIVLPFVGLFKELEKQGWGVVYFRPGDAEHLAQVLTDLLNDPARQTELGQTNYQKTTSFNGQFLSAHLDAFRHAASNRRTEVSDVVLAQEAAAKRN